MVVKVHVVVALAVFIVGLAVIASGGTTTSAGVLVLGLLSFIAAFMLHRGVLVSEQRS